jgi:hypothetical protein
VVVRRTPTLLNLGATWAQNWSHFAPASPILGLQAVWNHYGFSRYAEVGYFRVESHCVVISQGLHFMKSLKTSNDRAQKAIYHAQIESITGQIAAAQRGSQEKIELIQKRNASYGPPEEAYHSADSVVRQTPQHRQQQMLFQ